MSYESLRESFDSKDELDALQRPKSLTRHGFHTSMQKSARLAIGGLALAVAALLVSNCLTIVYLLQSQNSLDSQAHNSPSSVNEHWTTYQTVTEFSSQDQNVVDTAWNRFVINGFVALPFSWAKERQWPAARPMPGDDSKGIYVVDGFHQLHCLMSIRSTVTDLVNGSPVENRTHTMRHLNHCFDALRQSIQCRADATPLYVPKDTFWAGNDQQRHCKDWSALEDWVIEHTACYNGVECESKDDDANAFR